MVYSIAGTIDRTEIMTQKILYDSLYLGFLIFLEFNYIYLNTQYFNLYLHRILKSSETGIWQLMEAVLELLLGLTKNVNEMPNFLLSIISDWDITFRCTTIY